MASQSSATREQLLDTAEALFLEHGLDDVSQREIVRASGQRNQSALQYHFGNRDGLINAILQRRMRQVEARRRTLVDAALEEDPEPDLRAGCALIARAPFMLCREDKSFREFLGRFGQRLLASDEDIQIPLAEHDLPSLNRMRGILRQHLDHVDPELLALRVENVYRFVLQVISRRARTGGSFRGDRAELFFNNLVDQVAAMLAAPVSDATRALLASKE